MKMKSNLDFLFLIEHEHREGASIKFVYKTNEGMRVSEEFTSS